MVDSVEVCLSPQLIGLYELKGKTVVVVDILRATSCMTAGLGSGLKEIVPVAEIAECAPYREKGYLTAGERNGITIAGFDIGNSPFGFIEKGKLGHKVVMTTTNGTQALHKSREAGRVLIGAYLNIGALASQLLETGGSVLIHCAGWHSKPNIEDTLFAGALVQKLASHTEYFCDASLTAQALHKSLKGDPWKTLKKSAHFRRLDKMGFQKDLRFCFEQDVFTAVPQLEGERLVLKT